jgi:hypothetical protein
MLAKDTSRTRFWDLLTEKEKEFFRELNKVFNTKLVRVKFNGN